MSYKFRPVIIKATASTVNNRLIRIQYDAPFLHVPVKCYSVYLPDNIYAPTDLASLQAMSIQKVSNPSDVAGVDFSQMDVITFSRNPGTHNCFSVDDDQFALTGWFVLVLEVLG